MLKRSENMPMLKNNASFYIPIISKLNYLSVARQFTSLLHYIDYHTLPWTILRTSIETAIARVLTCVVLVHNMYRVWQSL